MTFLRVLCFPGGHVLDRTVGYECGAPPTIEMPFSRVTPVASAAGFRDETVPRGSRNPAASAASPDSGDGAVMVAVTPAVAATPALGDGAGAVTSVDAATPASGDGAVEVAVTPGVAATALASAVVSPPLLGADDRYSGHDWRGRGSYNSSPTSARNHHLVRNGDSVLNFASAWGGGTRQHRRHGADLGIRLGRERSAESAARCRTWHPLGEGELGDREQEEAHPEYTGVDQVVEIDPVTGENL